MGNKKKGTGYSMDLRYPKYSGGFQVERVNKDPCLLKFTIQAPLEMSDTMIYNENTSVCNSTSRGMET